MSSAWTRRQLTSVAAGVGACVVLGALALSYLGTPLMTQRRDSDSGAVEARLERYQANSAYTLYYLGRRFQEWPLNDASHERGGRVDALYGECEGSDTCGWPVNVINTPYEPLPTDTHGCRLLAPIRGVPTVYLSGLWLFTGTSSIQISALDEQSVAARETEIAAAKALRPVGGAPSTRVLPTPAHNLMANLEGICRPTG